MRCLLYFTFYSEKEPIFTLGPDWPYSLAKLLMVNLLIGYCINSFKKESWFHYTFNWILFLWNIVFLLLILWNPGLAPREPKIHSLDWLKTL